jgi:hypothetical protein
MLLSPVILVPARFPMAVLKMPVVTRSTSHLQNPVSNDEVMAEKEVTITIVVIETEDEIDVFVWIDEPNSVQNKGWA